MPNAKVNEPAKPATSKAEVEYTLTLIPSVGNQPYLDNDRIGPVRYRAVLRFGGEIIDDWRANDRNEAEVDAVRKKYAHQVKIGKVGEEVITLGDDEPA